MLQQGQVFPLTARRGGEAGWAYRYRIGGRGSRRVQRGGFATEQAAVEALERALERVGFKNSVMLSNPPICSGIAFTNHTPISGAFRGRRAAALPDVGPPLGEGRIGELGVSGREVSSAACGSSRAPRRRLTRKPARSR
jgi:hypothetical protein